VTFETDDNVDNYSIQFKISNNSSTIQFDSIRNEKNTIRTALFNRCNKIMTQMPAVHYINYIV